MNTNNDSDNTVLSETPSDDLSNDDSEVTAASFPPVERDAGPNMPAKKVTTRSMTNSIQTSTLWNGVHQFFLAETGLSGLQVGAIFRIGLALIFLYDRLLLHLDWDFFFSKTNGVLPADNVTPSDVVVSVFRFMPDPSYDELWMRMLHIAGFVQGTLLLMGILPRLQAVCVYLNIVSFHYRNDENMMYDRQDLLMIALSLYLCFLPLHHYSIPQFFRQNCDRSSTKQCMSWPIWPFRLIQCQMCCIYWGAGFGKLAYPVWRSGTAMSYVILNEDFFGGLFRPDVLYNSAGGLQIMTWASLFIECTCCFLVWPVTTRRLMVVTMVLFHLGIELAMNLHTFQWLSMLGWLSFLVQVNQEVDNGGTIKHTMEDSSGEEDKGRADESCDVTKRTSRNPLRFVGHVAFPLFIILFTALSAFPATDLCNLMEESTLLPIMEEIEEIQEMITSLAPFKVWGELTGMVQSPWNMFSNPNGKNTRIVGRITYRHNDTVEYWSQPEWTQMSAWERKKIFRQALFWQSVPQGKYWRQEMVFQRAICQRIAGQFGPDKDKIYSIALKIATTESYPRHLMFQESSSVWAWLSAPARERTFSDYYEELLYVHYPSGDRPDGINRVADFSYGEESDGGVWWDDEFYVYNPIREVYELVQNATSDEDTDNEKREILAFLTMTSPENSEL